MWDFSPSKCIVTHLFLHSVISICLSSSMYAHMKELGSTRQYNSISLALLRRTYEEARIHFFNLWQKKNLHQTSQMNHIGFKEVREESFHVCFFFCLFVGLVWTLLLYYFLCWPSNPGPKLCSKALVFVLYLSLFDTVFIYFRLAYDLFCSWARPWTSDLSFPIN